MENHPDPQTEYERIEEAKRLDPEGFDAALRAHIPAVIVTIAWLIAIIWMFFKSTDMYDAMKVFIGGIVIIVILQLAAASTVGRHQRNVYEAKKKEHDKLLRASDATFEATDNLRRLIQEIDRMAKSPREAAIMTGDIIVAAPNSALVIGSGTINVLRSLPDSELSQSMKIVAGLVEKSGNKKAAELLDIFSKEMSSDAPSKTLMEVIWSQIVEIVPTIKSMTDIVSAISKLFSDTK